MMALRRPSRSMRQGRVCPCSSASPISTSVRASRSLRRLCCPAVRRGIILSSNHGVRTGGSVRKMSARVLQASAVVRGRTRAIECSVSTNTTWGRNELSRDALEWPTPTAEASQQSRLELREDVVEEPLSERLLRRLRERDELGLRRRPRDRCRCFLWRRCRLGSTCSSSLSGTWMPLGRVRPLPMRLATRSVCRRPLRAASRSETDQSPGSFLA